MSKVGFEGFLFVGLGGASRANLTDLLGEDGFEL